MATRVTVPAGRRPGKTAAVVEDPQTLLALCATAVTSGKQLETPRSACVVLITGQFEDTFTECQTEIESPVFITELCAAHRHRWWWSSCEYGRISTAGAWPPRRCWSSERRASGTGPISPAQLCEVIIGPATSRWPRSEPVWWSCWCGIWARSGFPHRSGRLSALRLLARATPNWRQRDGQMFAVASYRRSGEIGQAFGHRRRTHRDRAKPGRAADHPIDPAASSQRE
jgi:hypothetical protein